MLFYYRLNQFYSLIQPARSHKLTGGATAPCKVLHQAGGEEEDGEEPRLVRQTSQYPPSAATSEASVFRVEESVYELHLCPTCTNFVLGKCFYSLLHVAIIRPAPPPHLKPHDRITKRNWQSCVRVRLVCIC